MSKESLHEIATAIQHHHEKEIKGGVKNLAIARVYCDLVNVSGFKPAYNVFWLLNYDKLERAPLSEKSDVGFPVYKNTPLGEAFIKYLQGS